MRGLALAGMALLLALALVLGVRWISSAERSAQTSAPGTVVENVLRVEPELSRPEEAGEVDDVELVPEAEHDARAGRRPLGSSSGETARIRGRVIDVETRTPLPPGVVGLQIRDVGFGSARIETVELDPQGAFETRSAFRTEGFVNVCVFQRSRKGLLVRGRNKTLLEEPHVVDGTELEIEVDPGVLVFVEAVTPEGIELEGARARISNGPGWVSLAMVERPYVLFPNLHPGIDGGQEATLEIEGYSSKGKLAGRTTVAWRCGIQRGIAVALELEPRVFGRVVDRDGEPVEDVIVTLLPVDGRAEGDWNELRDETDGGGRFDFQGLKPIEYRLVASDSFSRSEPILIRATPGWKDLGSVVLPATPGAGTIRGRVVDSKGEGISTLLMLEKLESRKRLVTKSRVNPWDGDVDHDEPGSFAFERVPPGAYSLRAIDLDGASFEPASMLVSPPAEGLEFRLASTPGEAFFVTARDKESGEAIQQFTVLASSMAAHWLGGDATSEVSFPPAGNWIVSAAGHRPARVRRSDFSSAGRVSNEDREWPGASDREIELWRAQVHLERGFGLPIVFMDGDSLQRPMFFGPLFGDPLAGVQVLVDGELLATSDAEGLALISLASEPAQLEFTLPGWRVVFDKTDDGMRLVVMVRQ